MSGRIKVRATFPGGYTRRVQVTISTGLAVWVMDGNVRITGRLEGGNFIPDERFRKILAAYRPRRASHQWTPSLVNDRSTYAIA